PARYAEPGREVVLEGLLDRRLSSEQIVGTRVTEGPIGIRECDASLVLVGISRERDAVVSETADDDPRVAADAVGRGEEGEISAEVPFSFQILGVRWRGEGDPGQHHRQHRTEPSKTGCVQRPLEHLMIPPLPNRRCFASLVPGTISGPAPGGRYRPPTLIRP